MSTPTQYNDVVTMFHSMFSSKYELLPQLEKQYFLSALGEYQLNVGELEYDSDTELFTDELPYYVIETLALIMYVRYLTQELSRVLKLNGLSGKDVQLTGVPASKIQTRAELEYEMAQANQRLYKQMQHCYR